MQCMIVACKSWMCTGCSALLEILNEGGTGLVDVFANGTKM
jgi:hypothetical protein